MSINPSRLPYIAQMAPCLFEYTDKDIGSSPNKTEEMHYIADMFKELVDIAYPMTEPNNEYNSSNDAFDALIYALDLKPINEFIIKDIEKGFQEIAKLMKNYKTPKKEGEF